MAKEFSKHSASSVGTTPVTVFTAITKTLIMGCNISNTTTFNLPVSVNVVNESSTTSIVSNFRLDGRTNEELVKNKIVLGIGDSIVVTSGFDNSIDVIISALEGV